MGQGLVERGKGKRVEGKQGKGKWGKGKQSKVRAIAPFTGMFFIHYILYTSTTGPVAIKLNNYIIPKNDERADGRRIRMPKYYLIFRAVNRNSFR